ncbi:MAG: serine hydrolase domain-containing protein, partial [Chloroflexota bacterium]
MIINRWCGLMLLAAGLVIGTALSPAVQNVPIGYAAQSSAPKVRADAAARIDSYFTAQLHAKRFSGSVLLAQGSTVLLSKGYGMADWDAQIHNSASTEFPFPFVGNAEFAAAAILQLEQAGKLRDAETICTYIPHCPAAWAPITVHELLTFTTGILDYPNAPPVGFPFGQALTLRQLLDQLGALPLKYKPDAGFSVNPSPPIEEYLVGQVSGESFGAYVQRHFLGPLGLTHTGYYLHYPSLPRFATAYQSSKSPGTVSDASDIGGAMYSTVTDFYRWQNALLSGQVLSAASTAKLLTPAFRFCPPTCALPGYST